MEGDIQALGNLHAVLKIYSGIKNEPEHIPVYLYSLISPLLLRKL